MIPRLLEVRSSSDPAQSSSPHIHIRARDRAFLVLENEELYQARQRIREQDELIARHNTEMEALVARHNAEMQKKDEQLDYSEANHRRTKSALEESQACARIDPLTGLLNRKAIEEGIIRIQSEEFRKLPENRQYVSMLMVDADHFKNINDTYGHSVGDIVLKRLADTLNNGKRAGDVIGRWG